MTANAKLFKIISVTFCFIKIMDWVVNKFFTASVKPWNSYRLLSWVFSCISPNNLLHFAADINWVRQSINWITSVVLCSYHILCIINWISLIDLAILLAIRDWIKHIYIVPLGMRNSHRWILLVCFQWNHNIVRQDVSSTLNSRHNWILLHNLSVDSAVSGKLRISLSVPIFCIYIQWLLKTLVRLIMSCKDVLQLFFLHLLLKLKRLKHAYWLILGCSQVV